MARLKAVIFDYNSTLVDDGPRVFKAMMKAIERTGGTPLKLYEEFRQRLSGRSVTALYRELGCTATENELWYWYERYLREVRLPVKPFADTLLTLKQLKKRRICTAVISYHPHELIVDESRALGFYGYLDWIEPVVRRAKASYIVNFLRWFEFYTSQALFVGDRVSDIKDAHQCGIKAAAFLGGIDLEQDLRAAKPDFILNNLSGLIEHVEP